MNFMIEIEYKEPISSPYMIVKQHQNKNHEKFRQKQDQKTAPEKEKTTLKSSYHWQPLQHKKYINFLAEKKELFELSLQRKIVAGIHTIMSRYIKSRTPRQCRSHHQKMMIKYQNVENIVCQHQHILNLKNRVLIKDLQGKATKSQKKSGKDENPSIDDFYVEDLFPQNHVNIYFENRLQQIQSYQYDQDLGIDFD